MLMVEVCGRGFRVSVFRWIFFGMYGMLAKNDEARRNLVIIWFLLWSQFVAIQWLL